MSYKEVLFPFLISFLNIQIYLRGKPVKHNVLHETVVSCSN